MINGLTGIKNQQKAEVLRGIINDLFCRQKKYSVNSFPNAQSLFKPGRTCGNASFITINFCFKWRRIAVFKR